MFTYDPVGNRLLRDGQGTNALFDNANRLIEDQEYTYEYDNNGNLTQKTNKATSDVTTYSYDAENQLIQVDKTGMTATYRYDGLGQRIEKNVNGTITRYVYDREDILSEFNGSNSLIAKYTHGPGIDEPLIMERGGVSHFYQMDGLGSIAELSDTAGSIAQSYVYDSFGQIVSQSGSVVNPYPYTGREFDNESGLYYYRARYYDARIGRFLQEDPIGFEGDGINLYVYALNNPINFVDPTGNVRIYGNYCGPLHGDSTGKTPAIDELDQCCKEHDTCIGGVGFGFSPVDTICGFTKNCDKDLCTCIRKTVKRNSKNNRTLIIIDFVFKCSTVNLGIPHPNPLFPLFP